MRWKPYTRPALFFLAAWSLIGCGSGLSGKYVSENGIADMSFEFQSGGKVMVEAMGSKAEGSYKVEGDQVTVYANGQNMVLTKSGDSLTGGPMGMAFKKQ